MKKSGFYKEHLCDFLREIFFSLYHERDLEILQEKAKKLHVEDSKFLNSLMSLNSSGLEEVRFEFNKLFIGPQKPLCPPYESYYLSGGHINKNKSIEEYYHQLGLEIKKREFLNDFIGIHFEFLYTIFYMLNKVKEDDKKEFEEILLDIKSSFLKEHFTNWIDSFCEQIIKHAHTKVWREFPEFLLHVKNDLL